MNTDHIDLYQVHEWDGQTPLEETLTALDDLVRGGKVRYIGASNYAAWQLMKALATSDHRHLERFVSQQIHYSLQNRDVEAELVPLSVDQGLGILVWSPLAGGLSGKYRRGVSRRPAAGTCRSGPSHRSTTRTSSTTPSRPPSRSARLTASRRRASLAYLLAKPAVTSLVVGARTVEQLRDNLAAADLELTADEIERLDEISGEPLRYPYWHQAATSSDRLSAADLTLVGRFLR